MSTGRLVGLSLLIGAGLHSLHAQPQLTTIQDTLYSANGTRMNATAVITWYSFQSSNGSPVGMQSLNVPIVNGAIYVQLVPNTTGTPVQPYTVLYESDGYIQYEETWMVPPSTTPLTVAAVRTSSTAGAPQQVSGNGTQGGSVGGAVAQNPIPESGVTGLSSDLSARPLKGGGYGTNRVAIVDQDGALETVVGNATDCVYVDGTSGPCFDPTQLPGYSDSEIPGGVVDGSNLNFALIGTPSPATSLLLFRNGIMQQQGFDYTLTGQVVQFGAGAAPQPGDTLIASYRLSPTAQSQSVGPTFGQGGGSSNGIVIFPVWNPQVVCSATGTTTSSTGTATLGTCTLPAGFLGPGDRVEIRMLLAHTGGTAIFNYSVAWGATTLLNRTGGLNDAMISAGANASVTTGATSFDGQSFGTVLVLLPFLTSAPDSITAPITISFQGNVNAINGVVTDALNLISYNVVRYPAISHP